MSKGNGTSASQTQFECAWCDIELPNDAEAIAISGQAPPETDLTGTQRSIVPILLERVNKTVPAIIPSSDSKAAREGKEFLFIVCSKSCAQAIKDALVIRTLWLTSRRGAPARISNSRDAS